MLHIQQVRLCRVASVVPFRLPLPHSRIERNHQPFALVETCKHAVLSSVSAVDVCGIEGVTNDLFFFSSSVCNLIFVKIFGLLRSGFPVSSSVREERTRRQWLIAVERGVSCLDIALQPCMTVCTCDKMHAYKRTLHRPPFFSDRDCAVQLPHKEIFFCL